MGSENEVRRIVTGDDGVAVEQEWRGKRLGWRPVQKYKHVHDDCFIPREGDIKYVDRIEYALDGDNWRATGKEVAGLTNTPRAGEPEGSRDRKAFGQTQSVSMSEANAAVKALFADSAKRTGWVDAHGEVISTPRKTFPHAEYDKIVEETVEQLKKLGELKGGEYAGDDDRLANFRRNGEALGLPMEAIWHTYTAKHWDAVAQYIKDLTHGKSRERLEPLSGRLDDIIVYCVLFKAMLAERERGLPISPGSKA